MLSFPVPAEVNGDELCGEIAQNLGLDPSTVGIAGDLNALSVALVGDELVVTGTAVADLDDATAQSIDDVVAAHRPTPTATPTPLERLAAAAGLTAEEMAAAIREATA